MQSSYEKKLERVSQDKAPVQFAMSPRNLLYNNNGQLTPVTKKQSSKSYWDETWGWYSQDEDEGSESEDDQRAEESDADQADNNETDPKKFLPPNTEPTAKRREHRKFQEAANFTPGPWPTDASRLAGWKIRIEKRVASQSGRPGLVTEWWEAVYKAQSIEELAETDPSLESWSLKTAEGLMSITSGEFREK